MINGITRKGGSLSLTLRNSGSFYEFYLIERFTRIYCLSKINGQHGNIAKNFNYSVYVEINFKHKLTRFIVENMFEDCMDVIIKN